MDKINCSEPILRHLLTMFPAMIKLLEVTMPIEFDKRDYEVVKFYDLAVSVSKNILSSSKFNNEDFKRQSDEKKALEGLSISE